jgi:2-polyprenyl-3-methyl-5-hydroxy-6-metoxy-1,4-benzoquinol methylase
MSVIEETCRLCRSTHTRRVFTKRQTPYWECSVCGLRFATPNPNPNLTGAIGDYEAAYLQYLGPDASDEANLSSLCEWMESIVLLPGKRLLDIGAGSGKLVRFLRARGIDAQGIEPSRALFDRFLGTEATFTCAMLDHYRSTAVTSFDVVTAFDVIEHVPDPAAFLGDVAALLEPGGVFFASTPDVGSLPAKAFSRRWHFYYPYHLSYFARRTLARAAEPHGLHIIDYRHRGRVRSVGYMVRYVAEFIFGATPPGWARWLDHRYVPINLFDTMYVALARRPNISRDAAVR